MSKEHYRDWQNKHYPAPPTRPSRGVAMLVVMAFFVVVGAVILLLAMR